MNADPNARQPAAEAATEVGAEQPHMRRRDGPSLWPVLVYLVLLPAAIFLLNWLVNG